MDADDGYRLYITNSPSEEFSPDDVSTLYRTRWAVELLFREFKSQFGKVPDGEGTHRLDSGGGGSADHQRQQSYSSVVRQSRYEQGDDCSFPMELWAMTFRSYAQHILSEIVVSFNYDPNLLNTWYQEARQPSPSCQTLLEEVNATLYAGFMS